ncbi:UbiA family prenyltransferase [Aquirhabdus parva]|uniref:UbiA family prenyltransferase n=1 Tax=Aquirhabdus parva TaxID=2283318 RepID=A0A345PAG4_9GAMM|nr:UbiA family prenyltransferase [Aquirhabdus parva]AXI04273.1 UbiA family prenyltransferase [Aquirhabdus parva]
MQNPDNKTVLVVDLDGTLIRSDLLIESIFLFLRLYPLQFFSLILWLFKGKVFLKRRLADLVCPSPNLLPYNKILLDWLSESRNKGSTLVLATASDIRLARSIAKHLAIFDDVLGTESINLSSSNKRHALVEKYGQRGFEYVGNSKADIAVWESASVIHIANPQCGVYKAANKTHEMHGNTMGQIFDDRPKYFRSARKAIRIHQWSKNVLIFLPLLASHRFFEIPLIQIGITAFLCFGLCASSVYLLNDLLDIEDDRLHVSKRNRPLASGAFPMIHAIFLIPLLLGISFSLALWLLPLKFTFYLLGYYLLTMAYSFWLKRIVMIDVVSLAMLYSIRVVAGGAAMALGTTFWVLTFCLFIFLSLAFVKRYTELFHARSKGLLDKTSGRGYYPTDFEMLASLGSASGYISVLVLALYINEPTTGLLYHSQKMLWVSCPLLLFWISRVWLLAHRGQMNDDPIVFALRDKVSRVMVVTFLLVFYLAAIYG